MRPASEKAAGHRARARAIAVVYGEGSDVLFSDGFETGDVSRWSSSSGD